jgi:hypothetical protein
MGLLLDDVEFGLALFGEKTSAATARRWTALQAPAGDVELIGIPDLKLSASSLSVEVNRGPTAGSMVDFMAQPLVVQTGAGEAPSSITFAMDGTQGAITRASGQFELDAFGFVQASGGFGIEKKLGTVTLNDEVRNGQGVVTQAASSVPVEMLLIGTDRLDAWVGAGGVGLQMSDVTLGLALLSEQTAGTPRTWTTLQADVGAAEFAGIEGLTLSADNLSLAINRPASDDTVVDYSLTNPADPTSARKTDIAIRSGAASEITLSLDGSRGEYAEARGHVSLDLFGFVQIEGEFAIEKASAPIDITLSSGGAPVQAEALLIGGREVNAFAGVNGGTDQAMGLQLTGVEFGLAL